MSDEGQGNGKGAAPIKLIIMGILVLALLGGGGFFAYKFFTKKKAEAVPAEGAAQAGGAAAHGEAAGHGEAAKEDEEEDEPAGGGGHGEAAGGPAVMVYKNIVNLEGPRRNAFLKVELHLLFRDPELGKAATSDKPTVEKSRIQALLLEMLSGKNLEEVSDLEARQSLRTEIKDKLNETFKPKLKPGEKEDPKHKKPKKPVKDVLVVDWAIQQ